MQRHPQHVSENQIPLDLGPTAQPARESALRAAYLRLELSRYLIFEQAMADPTLAIGIRNLADAMARRGTAESNTDARANHPLNCNLQFTQAFRAELRATIAAREQETADAP